MVEIMHVLS